MSSSAPGATGVTYKITFTPQASPASGEAIVDFCDNSPVYNDSCTVAAVGTDVPDTTSASGTGVTTVTGNHTVKITGLSFTNATPITITINNIKNPSNVGSAGTFYARIFTFATSGAASYTPAQNAVPTLGSPVDYGGVALSTASVVNVTSKVFETLSFCVYSGSCGTAPTVTLGTTAGGSLSYSSAYVNSNAAYSITSNALNGTKVYMYGQTLCRNATINFTNCPSGTSNQTISAATPGVTTAAAKTVGQEQFGMCVDVTGTTNLSAQAPYADTGGSNCHGLGTGTYAGTSTFGFDDTNGSNGTNGTNGSVIFGSSASNPVSGTGTFTFIANISPTTEYGTYQSNLSLVATSTY